MFGSNLAYFLLACPYIELSLLVSNIGVAHTKESAKSKILQEKNTLTKGKNRPRRVFVLLALLVGQSTQSLGGVLCIKEWILLEKEAVPS